MSFTHPLARAASIWTTGGKAGVPQKVLVVITTLTLDPNSKDYKGEKVEKLSVAARDWLDEHKGSAADFLLVNRPRDW